MSRQLRARRSVHLGLIPGILIWVGFVSGCASRDDSPFAKLDSRQSRLLTEQLESREQRMLDDDLRGAFGGGRPENVLALSGGDADGAFGCGLLHGWRNSPTDRRPAFDVVTGVSTGALMATFVFLGEDRDDKTLHDIYTRIRDADIFVGPFTPGLMNSVFDTIPLRRLIERRVTADVLSRVAAAHRAGRRLYVATVELDSGRLVIWPLSRLAAEATADKTPRAAEAGLKRFQTILLAAASVPVLFPPVEIDGGLHVDAGLLESIFIRRQMLGPDELDGETFANAQEPARAAPQSPRVPTVYAIVNGKIRTTPMRVANGLLQIGGRSLDIYTEALQAFNVRDIAHVAASHNPLFRFRYISLPPDVDDEPGPSLLPRMFDPAVMTHLYNKGNELGECMPAAWRDAPPRLDGER